MLSPGLGKASNSPICSCSIRLSTGKPANLGMAQTTQVGMSFGSRSAPSLSLQPASHTVLPWLRRTSASHNFPMVCSAPNPLFIALTL
jgi:hypothetical protein